jgi:hypothetical protein
MNEMFVPLGCIPYDGSYDVSRESDEILRVHLRDIFPFPESFLEHVFGGYPLPPSFGSEY